MAYQMLSNASTSAAAALGPVGSGAGSRSDSSALGFLNSLLQSVDLPSGKAVTRPTISYIVDQSTSSSPPQNPHGPNYHINQPKDDSSGSPSSSVSSVCERCEEQAPSFHCYNCHDNFCYDCCHSQSSQCQLNEHMVLPILTNNVKSNSVSTDEKSDLCTIHSEVKHIFCDTCSLYICYECMDRQHKNHNILPTQGAINTCRVKLLKDIQDGKAGINTVKKAIDRAVSLIKSCEKESAEASIKIKKTMRCFAQAIEDREKQLLEKVEKMRLEKITELTQHMNSYRGILAGLAQNNTDLVECVNFEGSDLIRERMRCATMKDECANLFYQIQLKDDGILFTPPSYEVLYNLIRQCNVHSKLEVAEAKQFHQASQYPPPPYPVQGSSNRSQQPDYFNMRMLGYDMNCSSSASPDSHRLGVGQAIMGSYSPVMARPTRHPVAGMPMLSFACEGQEQGQVSRPWGLCVDKDGNIIVADRRNNRIQLFSSNGEFITMFGSKGTGNGEFDLPAGITTDSSGHIIVIDKDNHRVQKFTSNGLFLLKFGMCGKDNGQFQYPWDVAVNTIGNIVVTDTRNHRIQLFTNNGVFLSKFVFDGGHPTKSIKGPTTPRGVCFTTSGNIIVSDFENHRLIIVDNKLSQVLQYVGSEGTGIHHLSRPSGIVTDDEGRVVVADSKNHRVLLFSEDMRVLWAVNVKSPGLDDKDRPSDVALTPEGQLVVLFETLPDTARDVSSHGKQYIKIY